MSNDMDHKTDTDSARVAFEAWFSDGGRSPKAIERNGTSGSYRLAAAATAWTAFQAGRSSLAASAGSEPVAVLAAERDELFQAVIDFIRTLTGMEPPPIEAAPPEVFAPFRAFVDTVQAITDKRHPSPPEGMVAEQSLLKVLAAVQRYLPPDGPSAKDTLSEIIAIVDPWPLGRLEKS